MAIYHDKEFDCEGYDIEIAVPIKETVKRTHESAGGLCAMGICKGPYFELTSLYAKLEQWIDRKVIKFQRRRI